MQPFDPYVFSKVQRSFLWLLVGNAATECCEQWSLKNLPIVEWGLEQIDTPPPDNARTILATLALYRDDTPRFESLLAGLESGIVTALRAAAAVLRGQWAEGQAGFETAFKQRNKELGGGVRKQLFPRALSWLYPVALMAQGGASHLALARKFCIAESGSRNPYYHSDWGMWVHVIDVRAQGLAFNRELLSYCQPGLVAPPNTHYLYPCFIILMLAAWLGSEAIAGNDPATKLADRKAAASLLRTHLEKLKFAAAMRLLDNALLVLDGKPPTSPFFVAGPAEKWRTVLTVLQSLDSPTPSSESAAPSRLLWGIDIDKEGRLLDITPFEQKRGPRGWNKPKEISLNKLLDSKTLAPHDSAMVTAIRPDPNYSSRHYLDLPKAIAALVGHPSIVVNGEMAHCVELVEAAPELEVVREGDRFTVRIDPPLPAPLSYYAASSGREIVVPPSMVLQFESPQRLRLVRFTAEQRQVAQLLNGKLTVPAQAQAELDKAVHVLTHHFQVHADSTQPARQIESDSRLRAELSPVGEHLAVRLVVAPLGLDGPRLSPGHGRTRLMATINGEVVGATRDLETERRHLESVINSLEYLELDDDHPDNADWLIQDPEHALALVEALPQLPAIAAIDWPKGKSVRVMTLDTRQVSISVGKERDWFRLSGQTTLDEGLVLQLETLLSTVNSKSRFIPIGDGVYAALTRSLKQKLADLAAVIESDKHGHKVPGLTAAWLDEVLDGTQLDASRDFKQAIERLRRAQNIQPSLPGSLQAELRAYQEDGYRWAMRLADAGMGGILADDMGLGKTLQALGVMLQRAAGGPALVIAPTSVCGNWRAETLRFAPSLNIHIYSEYSESERERLVAEAAPYDVVIISYTLMHLAQERLASRTWHTMIADEAQAIKNSAAKRTQAIFDLDADFRLALSGTPVENRLAELWSIMRLVNPGLLGTLNRFNERFANPIERNRDREAQHILKRLIAPFLLRRTKAQVLLDLPPRTELVLSIVPETTEAAHYEALRREAVKETAELLESPQAGQAHFNILAQLTRLRRAACDPRLVSPDLGIQGAKVQAFAELAAELSANGHKTLVFSQFVDFLSILREPLDAAGIHYQYLDGATPAAERTRRVAAFQGGEGDLFLISLKAGGFGLNLTAADYVVITDPWWNPAAEDQAMGRAHRIGQLRPVTVYRLVTQGTVEESIVNLHHDKRALAEGILADGDATAVPNAEDLIALIRGE
ncbi:MAG TPA: DEAD/DEAH box helicase [Rhodocyclaceae bacterium]|nr:DEAD/DEAH box helicase [Rhodocyclaceae bacterium]